MHHHRNGAMVYGVNGVYVDEGRIFTLLDDSLISTSRVAIVYILRRQLFHSQYWITTYRLSIYSIPLVVSKNWESIERNLVVAKTIQLKYYYMS